MLSGITNYFFGGAQPAEDEQPMETQNQSEAELRLKTSPADDEWVFVDKSRGGAQTGPLENLLIEHPSMSVYGPRGRQTSTGVDSDGSSSSGSPVRESRVGRPQAGHSRAVNARPPRRPAAVAARAGLQASIQAAHSSQQQKQRRDKRRFSRNKLEKSNKVVQTQSMGGHRLRRKDHRRLDSRVSNNRRC